MKITMSDLDQNIISKLSKLDNLSTGLLYSDNGNITTKEVNEIVKSKADKVFSQDDITEIKKHLYKSSDNYISSFDRAMLLTNNAIQTKTFLKEINATELFKNQYKFITYFKCKNSAFLVNNVCDIYWLDVVNKSYKYINLAQLFKNLFNIKKMYPSDITYVTALDENTALISLAKNGVYSVNYETKTVIKITKELNIDIIKVLDEDRIICARKSTLTDNLFIINKNGQKVLKYNQISKLNEYIENIIVADNCFYVMSDVKSSLHSDVILHKFTLDLAQINYEYDDYSSAKNKRDSQYMIFGAVNVNNDVYILTVKNDNVIMWKYVDEFNSYEYYDLDLNIPFDDITDFDVTDSIINIITKDRIYQYEDMKIVNNIKLNIEYKNAFGISGTLYCLTDLSVYFIPQQTTQSYSILTFDISFVKGINSVDFYADSDTKLKYKFYDPQTNVEISPYFGIYLNSTNVLYRLLNITTNVRVQVSDITESTNINGIVVHANNTYYK